MTIATDHPSDAELEAELRAMLQRRAADIQPSRTPARPVIRLDGAHPRDERRRIRLVRVAAALLLVAGAAGLAALAADRWTTGNRPGTAIAEPPARTAGVLRRLRKRRGPDRPWSLLDADGDEGTFELIRLDDGRWGMTSLRSDALDVVEVGRTGPRIRSPLCRPRMPTWASAVSVSDSSPENRT